MHDEGGRGPKMWEICVTSFMDVPFEGEDGKAGLAFICRPFMS